MTQKPFEELTISDDFMFCKVMEYEPICREFLEMLLVLRSRKLRIYRLRTPLQPIPEQKPSGWMYW